MRLGPALPALAQASAPLPSCRVGLAAGANGDASITLTWPSVAGATAYQVVVRANGADWTPLAPQVPPSATVFTDSGSVSGRTYSFVVVPMSGPSQQMTSSCPVTVTAIPFVPSPLVAALALPGAVGAFALLRRRG